MSKRFREALAQSDNYNLDTPKQTSANKLRSLIQNSHLDEEKEKANKMALHYGYNPPNKLSYQTGKGNKKSKKLRKRKYTRKNKRHSRRK